MKGEGERGGKFGHAYTEVYKPDALAAYEVFH